MGNRLENLCLTLETRLVESGTLLEKKETNYYSVVRTMESNENISFLEYDTFFFT